MENTFNLKQFLAEGKLLKENTLKNDIEDFKNSIEIDNYQRSDDDDYEEAEADLEFFLDMYPEYKGREEEIQQILNSPSTLSPNVALSNKEDIKNQIKDLTTKYMAGDSSVLPQLKALQSKLR